MKIITTTQGSEDWLAHRRTVRNASDAPAMMGASPYISRNQLIQQYATGITREIDDETQRRFDRGHEVEPLLRARAELLIQDVLYPIVAVSNDGYLGASFDGVTVDENIILEAKQPNAEKFNYIKREVVPLMDYWQIIQQFAVCELAARCLYMVGDGTEHGTAEFWIDRSHIAHDIPKLIAGWRQFDADVEAYRANPTLSDALKPIGVAPENLPALHIEVTGMVTASNLTEFRDHAIAVFKNISTDLKTDQDFSDAEQTIKWCSNIEDRLVAAKQHALSQTESIDALFRAIDSISSEARAKRLELDKLVKVRKESIRADIVEGGYKSVLEHYKTINVTMGMHAIHIPQSLRADIASTIKGKKTITSIRDAVDTAVASAKIDASGRSEHVRTMVAALAELSVGYETLFPDAIGLCASKNIDDLRNLVAIRISEHKAREEAKVKAEKDKAERLVPASIINPADVPAPIACATPLPTTDLLKIGGINAALYPLSITAEGLAMIGFHHVNSERTSKLYTADDLPKILLKLSRRLFDYAKKIEEQP